MRVTYTSTSGSCPSPSSIPQDSLHTAISKAGEAATLATAKQLTQLRKERDRVTVTIARRELRKWLRKSKVGKAVEEAVAELLAKTEAAA